MTMNGTDGTPGERGDRSSSSSSDSASALLPAPLEMLRALVALPGPPGQEEAVRDYVREMAQKAGCACDVDAKGNLLAAPGERLPERPSIVVTAHLDEIALMVTGIDSSDRAGEGARLRVSPLGGAYTYKWGEGPVEIRTRGGEYLPGILSFGSIHTSSPASAAQQAREGNPITWSMADVITGREADDLSAAGVRPGTRVVLARHRRSLTEIGGDTGLVASYFLDDRADLVAWLLALPALREAGGYENVLFAATVSEEVGGEGASYLMQGLRPDICVALEIGPITPDADLTLDARPTIWVSDTYAATDPRDLDLLEDAAREIYLTPQWQALTRGGSDATCAASRGLCARPVTIAFPAENSHGYEIMHRDAPEMLARLLVAYLNRLREGSDAGETE